MYIFLTPIFTMGTQGRGIDTCSRRSYWTKMPTFSSTAMWKRVHRKYETTTEIIKNSIGGKTWNYMAGTVFIHASLTLSRWLVAGYDGPFPVLLTGRAKYCCTCWQFAQWRSWQPQWEVPDVGENHWGSTTYFHFWTNEEVEASTTCL